MCGVTQSEISVCKYLMRILERTNPKENRARCDKHNTLINPQGQTEEKNVEKYSQCGIYFLMDFSKGPHEKNP